MRMLLWIVFGKEIGIPIEMGRCWGGPSLTHATWRRQYLGWWQEWWTRPVVSMISRQIFRVATKIRIVCGVAVIRVVSVTVIVEQTVEAVRIFRNSISWWDLPQYIPRNHWIIMARTIMWLHWEPVRTWVPLQSTALKTPLQSGHLRIINIVTVMNCEFLSFFLFYLVLLGAPFQNAVDVIRVATLQSSYLKVKI